MQGKILMVIGWLATVGGAWMLGSQSQETSIEEGGQSADVVALHAEVATLRAQLAARGPSLVGAPTPAEGMLSGAPASGSEARAVRASRLAIPKEPVHELDITGMTKPEEIVAHFIAYARTMLSKGRAGHLELLHFMGMLENKKELGKQVQAVFEPLQERAIVYAYDAVKFAMDNDQQVLALTETFFEQMAENPSWFEGMDDDPFELFTEGLGMMVPAVASEAQMKRFRAYAETIVSTPADSLPKAIERNRRDIQRLLQVWAPQLSVDEILAKIKQGSLSDAEIAAYLPMLPSEALAYIDVGRVLAPGILSGDYRSIRMLRNVDLDPSTLGDLDARVVAALGHENSRVNSWTVRQYLESTKRQEWSQAQGFFERGLASGEKAADELAQTLMQLQSKPPTAWVRDAVVTYPFSEAMARQLKTRFKVE